MNKNEEKEIAKHLIDAEPAGYYFFEDGSASVLNRLFQKFRFSAQDVEIAKKELGKKTEPVKTKAKK